MLLVDSSIADESFWEKLCIWVDYMLGCSGLCKKFLILNFLILLNFDYTSITTRLIDMPLNR